MKCLVLVAHPDDETIWMGGTILHHKDWNWTIVSLCRKYDKDRRPRFMNVCKNLNATPIISDLDDEKLQPLSVKEVEKKILSTIPDREYDHIYTHGDNGEYGHIRHIEIHKAVKRLIRNKLLKCNKLFCFSYKKGKKTVPKIPELKIPVPNGTSADKYVQLNEDNFKKKQMLVKKMYGFKGDSFEALSCHKEETFKLG